MKRGLRSPPVDFFIVIPYPGFMNRKTFLATGEYYHIFNRGVARQQTFFSKYDYKQAILGLFYYRITNPQIKLSKFKEIPSEDRKKLLDKIYFDRNGLVEVLSYVFMPNHFHFLLKQTAENGISIFMSKFTNSYTKYFNKKHDRPGPVFQGVFKSVHVTSGEQLIHLSRYIHLNPVTSSIIPSSSPFSYLWSSLPEFIGEPSGKLLTAPIMENFRTAEKYKSFLLDNLDYAKRLEEIKHLIFED